MRLAPSSMTTDLPHAHSLATELRAAVEVARLDRCPAPGDGLEVRVGSTVHRRLRASSDAAVARLGRSRAVAARTKISPRSSGTSDHRRLSAPPTAGDLGREPVYQECRRPADPPNTRPAQSGWKELTVSAEQKGAVGELTDPHASRSATTPGHRSGAPTPFPVPARPRSVPRSEQAAARSERGTRVHRRRPPRTVALPSADGLTFP